MKKKRTSKKEAGKRWDREDEVLDLKELMDVQGGVEKDEEKEKGICLSLGCYTLEVPPIEDSMETHHEK